MGGVGPEKLDVAHIGLKNWKTNEFQSQIFGFSDFQMFNYRFLFFLAKFSGKDVGEIANNK